MTQSKKNLKRRAINFDLDTNIMCAYVSKSKGYRQIRKFMLSNGFEHPQGSGYVSKKPIYKIQAIGVVRALVNQYPWIAACVKDIMLTDYSRNSNLTNAIKNGTLQHNTPNRPKKANKAKTNLKNTLRNNGQSATTQSHNAPAKSKQQKTTHKPIKNDAKNNSKKPYKGGGAAL